MAIANNICIISYLIYELNNFLNFMLIYGIILNDLDKFGLFITFLLISERLYS